MEPPREDESIPSSNSESEDQSTTHAPLEEKSRRRVQNAQFETLFVPDISLPFLNDSDTVG